MMGVVEIRKHLFMANESCSLSNKLDCISMYNAEPIIARDCDDKLIGAP